MTPIEELYEEAEKVLLNHTASSEWKQIKYMDWTSAEVQGVIVEALKKQADQLKAKHKEDVINARVDQAKELVDYLSDSDIKDIIEEAEEYYNETFKQ